VNPFRRGCLPTQRNSRLLQFGILLVFGLASPALASWTVTVRGQDVTALAGPVDRMGTPDVNATALAATLGLQVRMVGDTVVIFDARGTEWRGQNGALTLESIARSLPLRTPLTVQGTAIFLPLNVAADFAGLRLELDAATQRATLGPPQSSPNSGAVELQQFVVDKSPEERARDMPVAPAPASARGKTAASYLPSAQDSLRLDYGIGYVQGFDLGVELSASGRAYGANVGLNTLLAFGARGPQIRSGYLTLADGSSGRELDAGQLVGDLRGAFIGARYTWRAGPGRQSAVSLILSSPQYPAQRPALAYRDELELAPGLRLGGEAATDGSLFLKGAIQTKRFSIFGFYRTGPDRLLRGAGAFFSYGVGRGISVYGGVSRSATGLFGYDWRSIAVTVPVRHGIDLTVEHSENGALNSGNSLNAVSVSLPVGRMRLLTRYQFGVSQSRDVLLSPIWARPQQRDLTFATSVFNNPRLSMNYQASVRWQQDATALLQGQLVSSLRLSDRTRLEMYSAFPQALDPSQLRVRITHDIRKDLALSIDYGLLTPYQTVTTRSSDRGLMLMLRSHIDVATPAQGTDVSGRVVDQAGRPVAQTVVKLNDYQTQTDDRGRYTFHHVERGRYTARIDGDALAADYKVGLGVQLVQVGGRRVRNVDFVVVQLRTIGGRVIREGDGGWAGPRGVGGVVVTMSGDATVTADDGTFTFYNVEPGKHTIRLDTGRLSRDYDAASPTAVDVNLVQGSSVTNVEFRVSRHDKTIIFQALP
jgi:hypothetical protein